MWTSATEGFDSQYLIVAADGAVWWSATSHVYRAEGLTVASIASSGSRQLVHDPQDPTAVLAYPLFADPRRFSHSGGTISLSSPGCSEAIEDPDAAAIRQDGTAGVIVSFPSWVWGT